MRKSAMRLFGAFAIAVPALAITWVVLFYSFCWIIYSRLGFVPNGKYGRFWANMDNGLLDHCLAEGFFLLLALFPFWLFVLFFGLVNWTRSSRLGALLGLIGYGGFAFVCMIDPQGWFWDVFFD
ncbi:hypothetical protein [Frigoriglobus tundricola]|uniref:Uncharacterized protein n=1 Tax=Frigoriglobus tundricola TaxID=2774151 RepID=A0A6M5Z1N6_9BACT|nr:hypothetical protein [Frigoriglobus tundricola]QJX00280.1 hypothetical protein FTUN_7905 [Frigoriglobus tundricola]